MKKLFLNLLLPLVMATVFGIETKATEGFKPKYGPEKSPIASPIFKDHQYLASKRNKALDFWNLIGFYVPQINPAACSAASVAMIVNGARATFKKSSEDKVVTQEMLLNEIKVDNWKARLSTLGYKGKHGVTLEILARVTEAAFQHFGFPKARATGQFAMATGKDAEAKLKQDLIDNEKSEENFILVNFDQGQLTQDEEVGHISPVGAFDSKTNRVLILDPDRSYYEPYWVSLENLNKAMNTKDSESQKVRGYVLVKTQGGGS